MYRTRGAAIVSSDDGLRDGAEGLGVVQAQRLKAKLSQGRNGARRLRVGRVPYVTLGDQRGFGLAPLEVIGAVQTAAGLFKGSKDGVRLARNERAFGPAKAGNKDALRFLFVRAGGGPALTTEANSFKEPGEGQWGPWATAVAKNDAAAKHDVAIAGLPPAPTPAPAPAAPPAGPSLMDRLFPPKPNIAPGVQPAPGPTTDVTGAPAPALVPTPSPTGGQGVKTFTEQVAGAAKPTVQQAGMFGLDFSNPMVKLAVAGAGLIAIAQFAGGGSRRR